jgi:alkylation response protein AidB-like acyl-CoA dehydrogenase
MTTGTTTTTPQPAGHSPATTHDQWIVRARAVADALAVDALDRDRANAKPLREVQLLRESGLLALLVPPGNGGFGGTWRTALEAVRVIAASDTSIAHLLGYHYVNLVNLWTSGGPAIQELLGRPTARDGWFWGDSVNPTDPDLVLEPAGPDPATAGYRLNGTKRFSTGASVGDAVIAAGVVSATGEPLLVAVIPRDGGVTFGGDWDNLGQRLSDSGSATFAGAPVPPEHVVGSLAPDRVTPLSSLITPAIQAVFGNLYLGAAQGALSRARDYTVTTSRPWVLSGIERAVDEPYVLATYGGFVARADAVEALADRVSTVLDAAFARGADLTWEERGEAAVAVARLKVVATEIGLEATAGIFEVTGARSTSNEYGFDRFWRNVRTHSVHDPVAYKRREVGRHFLTGEHPAFTLYT